MKGKVAAAAAVVSTVVVVVVGVFRCRRSFRMLLVAVGWCVMLSPLFRDDRPRPSQLSPPPNKHALIDTRSEIVTEKGDGINTMLMYCQDMIEG